MNWTTRRIKAVLNAFQDGVKGLVKMSEILFRAKRKDNGEWIESLTLLKLNEHLYMFQTAWCEITYDLQCNITAIRGKKPFFVEGIPETVGRYTGLTDKNGVKIFEGDIIEYEEKYGIARYPVVWDKKTARFAVAGYEGMIVGDFFFYTPKKCKIIGNIHDTTELLKGEEK